MGHIPSFFIDSVVAIGATQPNAEPQWQASGFFYAHPVGEDETDGETLYHVYLVTNRHVIRDFPADRRMCLRVNPEADGPAKTYPLNLVDQDGQSVWFFHPNLAVDVAVSWINFEKLKQDAMQVGCFSADPHAANVGRMRELGVTEGDFAYALGFPMGLVGQIRSSVIVRSAIIARVRDTLVAPEQPFLVDAAIFPGNSGGPIVLRPEVAALGPKAPVTSAYLIGIVAGYLPYRDIAVSQQTKRARIEFEENSGLGVVFSVDCIESTIAEHQRHIATRRELAGEPGPTPEPVQVEDTSEEPSPTPPAT